jgi:propane monooxygenase small subunit
LAGQYVDITITTEVGETITRSFSMANPPLQTEKLEFIIKKYPQGKFSGELEDPTWQGVRHAVEAIMGATDYLEQYFAINVVFEPLVGELVRSGFFIPVGSANKDSMTPSVISAAEADYERNLANTVDLVYLLANDAKYASENRALFQRWLSKHAELGDKAANALQPLWSRPHAKPVSFQDARSKSHERLGQILGELGLKQ